MARSGGVRLFNLEERLTAGEVIFYTVYCQGLQLWVLAMPKSKWWTSKSEILKDSP